MSVDAILFLILLGAFVLIMTITLIYSFSSMKKKKWVYIEENDHLVEVTIEQDVKTGPGTNVITPLTIYLGDEIIGKLSIAEFANGKEFNIPLQRRLYIRPLPYMKGKEPFLVLVNGEPLKGHVYDPLLLDSNKVNKLCNFCGKTIADPSAILEYEIVTRKEISRSHYSMNQSLVTYQQSKNYFTYYRCAECKQKQNKLKRNILLFVPLIWIVYISLFFASADLLNSAPSGMYLTVICISVISFGIPVYLTVLLLSQLYKEGYKPKYYGLNPLGFGRFFYNPKTSVEVFLKK